MRALSIKAQVGPHRTRQNGLTKGTEAQFKA